MLRRIGSVLLGFIVILLLVGVTDAILEKIFPTQFAKADGSYAVPGMPLVAFIFGYVFIYAGVGGYLAAWIAPRSPRSHALALGALLLLVSIAFALANPQQQPMWYLMTSTVFVVLGCVAGGSLKARSARAPA